MLAMLPTVLAACNKDDVVTPSQSPDMPGLRPITETSSAYQNKVYEYTPAPGQFINDTQIAGFSGNETTPELACEYAGRRLREQNLVSLGSFGGYIVVGFDHSIVNSHKRYDIAIKGNAISTSNEPGIVWVMQDENRNGLPDDTWYELKGSEYDDTSTNHNYSVTYFRPDGPGEPVRWKDSEGAEGSISYLPLLHRQEYYYPAWITANSYTLTGTCLKAANYEDKTTGKWVNPPYGWGYVDNQGSDTLDALKQVVGFRIDNAVDCNGQKVNLPYVDFIKVQQAVMAVSGQIGENSCEVLWIGDAGMLF